MSHTFKLSVFCREESMAEQRSSIPGSKRQERGRGGRAQDSWSSLLNAKSFQIASLPTREPSVGGAQPLLKPPSEHLTQCLETQRLASVNGPNLSVATCLGPNIT